jgi:hypothetical protein
MEKFLNHGASFKNNLARFLGSAGLLMFAGIGIGKERIFMALTDCWGRGEVRVQLPEPNGFSQNAKLGLGTFGKIRGRQGVIARTQCGKLHR